MSPDSQTQVAEWVFPVVEPPRQNARVSWDSAGVLTSLEPAGDDIIPGTVLLPGFINLHTHLGQWRATPIERQPEQSFSAWLMAVVSYLRSSEEAEQAEWPAKSLREVIASGCTTVVDNVQSFAVAEQLLASGLRTYLGVEVIAPQPVNEVATLAALPAGLQRAVQLYQQLGDYRSRQVKVGWAPHSIYNVSPSAWQWLSSQQTDADFVSWHLAESKEEAQWLSHPETSDFNTLHQTFLEQTYPPVETGLSPWAYWLKYYGHQHHTPTLLAHGVDLTEAEWEAMVKTSNLTVAHCPRSNQLLHGNTIPAERLTNEPVGLGTDGRLSTPDLDSRQEALQAKSRANWSWNETLEALTLAGAKALGQGDKLGQLRPGAWADMTLWQLQEPAVNRSADEVLAAVLQGKARLQKTYLAGRVIFVNNEGKSLREAC